MAAKYLDKELAGRIQQIQLLAASKDQSLSATNLDQERLWHQLEGEIQLHRHKVVVRACRARSRCFGAPNGVLGSPAMTHEQYKNGVGQIRNVLVKKGESQGIGISITGGKDVGVPIIISQIHPNSPAQECGLLYVGDAILSVNGIDLKSAHHQEAVQILSSQVRFR